MKAIRIHEHGDSSHLIYEDMPLPEPKAGEVRVKVTAIGLNFIEIYHRKGLYKIPLPTTLGSEFSGTVDQLGPGVTGFQVGDRVVTSNGAGGYAEYALAPADKLVPVPQGVSLEQAAALLLQGLTAHYLATSTYPLKPGDCALIHAAAGGVGQLLVQIARRRGARVIATVSTEEKARIARECGADEVILYTQEDFETETRRLTNGKGVNVVYDSVGKTTFDKSLNCLMPLGYMVLYGQSSGPVAPIDPQILNQKGSLFLTRPSAGPYTATREALLQRTNELFQWLSAGELKLRIDRTFPLKDASAAQDYMESRQTKGKVLLIPAP